MSKVNERVEQKELYLVESKSFKAKKYAKNGAKVSNLQKYHQIVTEAPSSSVGSAKLVGLPKFTGNH